MKSKISIIIPIYNNSGTIDKCLVSIFSQTFKDFEIIVVNDGSTDNLRKKLRRWESKIKIYHQKNKGAAAARNFGFGQSVGKYVLFCDADIIMKSDMIEKMYSLLERKRAFAYVYSSFRFGWKKFRLWPFDDKRLKKMPYIPTMALIRRETFVGFDENLKKFQDWDLWLTMLELGYRGIWINQVLYRAMTGGTMSRWLPSFLYKILWLRSVQEYSRAENLIRVKHNLN
ncbi:MAG TPA: glycosyltransferase family A protein [Patescibacteria group bacterium]|nr:glycosyltransferase family A protein [Patescibacteria group bacterium]